MSGVTNTQQEEDKKPNDQSAHINLKVKGQVGFLLEKLSLCLKVLMLLIFLSYVRSLLMFSGFFLLFSRSFYYRIAFGCYRKLNPENGTFFVHLSLSESSKSQLSDRWNCSFHFLCNS